MKLLDDVKDNSRAISETHWTVHDSAIIVMDAPFGEDCKYFASLGKIFAHTAGKSTSKVQTTHHKSVIYRPENTQTSEGPHSEDEEDDNSSPNQVTCNSDDEDHCTSPPPRLAYPGDSYGHFQVGGDSNASNSDLAALFYQLANTQADSVAQFRQSVSAFANKLQRLRQGDRYMSQDAAHWSSMIGGFYLRHRSQVASLVSFSLHVEVALSLHKISKRTHRGISQFLTPYKLSVGHTFRLLDGCQLQFEEIFEIKRGLHQSEKGPDRIIRSSIPFLPMNPYRPQSDAKLNSLLRRLPRV